MNSKKIKAAFAANWSMNFHSSGDMETDFKKWEVKYDNERLIPVSSTSNCCDAPIWQRDPVTGDGHCFDCGEHCATASPYPFLMDNDYSRLRSFVQERPCPVTREHRKRFLEGTMQERQVIELAKKAGAVLLPFRFDW